MGTPGTTFNEVQTLRVDADGGTFVLSITVNGVTTSTGPLAHNISAAYRCRLLTPPDPARAYPPETGQPPQPGQWAWHPRCPDELLEPLSSGGELIRASAPIRTQA